jgi:hypothetical protein
MPERDTFSLIHPPGPRVAFPGSVWGGVMTVPEWLNASEPQAMLEFLRTRGRTSERKLRLLSLGA